MILTLSNTKDIAKEFANAVESKDLNHIKNLLSEDGIFDIQSNKTTIEANKSEFINWFAPILENSAVTKIEYDQCLHCSIGNPVVLFNDGKFPRTIKSPTEYSKTGIMLDIKDGKIITLKFCFKFLKNENKAILECMVEKMREKNKKQN